MAYLSQLVIFPIKSLDGIAVSQATLLESGALKHDREFAIVDAQGRVVNGKRTNKVQGVRAQFDLEAWTVALSSPDGSLPDRFHLELDRSALEAWLSRYFGFSVTLQQNQQMGFPDDTESPGPTLISTETLQTVAAWFPDLGIENIRGRFRTNLELAAVAPFWEDQLFDHPDRGVSFQIGDVQLDGVNPCQRCIVPVRDPATGQTYPQFQSTFVAQRQQTLPAWANRDRFNHFYKLAVNTRVAAQAGKQLRVGDAVQLKDP